MLSSLLLFELALQVLVRDYWELFMVFYVNVEERRLQDPKFISSNGRSYYSLSLVLSGPHMSGSQRDNSRLSLPTQLSDNECYVNCT